MMEDKLLVWKCKRGSRDALRLEFDRETKLLVSMKQWENARWEDPAGLVVEKITYYESLPDDLFQFQIPPGATVVER